MTDPAEDERELRGLAASSALELASTAYLVPASDIDVSGDIEEMTLDYALDVLGYLEALQSATRTVRKQLEEFIATKLEGVQYYRHRDQIIRVGRGGTWKVKDEVVNDGTLARFLGADWVHIVNLKAQGAVTKTNIELLAQTNWVSPDATNEDLQEAANQARSMFFEYKRNDSAISTMPPEKAPKKCQALEHGQSVAAKPRLEAG